MRRKKILSVALVFCIAAFLFGEIIHLEYKISTQKKLTKKKLKKLHQFSAFRIPDKHVRNPHPFSLPEELQSIPMAENQFIRSIKTVDIRNVHSPYNAALIEHGDSYLLFFRYDTVRQMHLNYFTSHIGMVELDKEFNQTEKEIVTIDTGSDFSEDPRVFTVGNKCYLTYNDLVSQNLYSRSIYLAELDIETASLRSIQPLDLKLQQIEKNWAPFSYTSKENTSEIHFEYQLFGPRKILKLANQPEWVDFSDQRLEQIGWDKKWGIPRGGTPARLIDGQYISFFHSSFIKGGVYWYVIGAYTFEAKPPFNVTAISPHPIIFRGIYDSKIGNTVGLDKFVLFPSGFAIETKEEKTLLHVGCGENDGAIKIISIDKDELLKSLKKI